MNRGAGTDGPAVRLRGPETNAECGPLGRLVKAVAESAHDAQHADVAAGGEFELERHGAFDTGAACFVGVPGVGLKTISTGRSVAFVNAATEGWAGALARRSNPAVCTSLDPFAAPRGAGSPLLNPPVATAPFAAARDGAAALPNPPVVTAAVAWLVRAPFVRSNRPVSGGRWTSGLSTGRSATGVAAATSGAGGGSTGLVTIGATGSGFGTSALASSRIVGGGAGGAGRRGATTGADGNVTGERNTLSGRMRGVGGFAGAPIVTAIRTTTMACTPTLRHKPLVERPRGRVLNRASPNRIDMCRTELTCRSVLLQRRCCSGSSCSKRSAATIVEPGQIGRARATNLRFWTPLAKLRDPRAEPPRIFRAKAGRSAGGPVVAPAALAPARASPCRILPCPSHVAGSVQEPARLLPARRSSRCSRVAATGRHQPARAAWPRRWAPCLGD